MATKYFFQQGIFVIRFRYLSKIISLFRNAWFYFLGMNIGKGTFLPRINVNWPHQIQIGKNCTLEHDIHLKFDGIWQQGKSIRIGDNVFIGMGCEFNIREDLEIGDNTLIASGCKFIDHDHGISRSELMNAQSGAEKPIKIGADVWLGCNVIVLKGVEIGKGAIVAAGAVITKPIGDYEIWAGVPAKKIGDRK
jgi:acetyltransferase-like isoleucine patch superfamily enzyme